MRWLVSAALLLAACELPPPGAANPDLTRLPVDGGPGDLTPPSGTGTLTLLALDDESGLSLPSRVLITAVAPTPAMTFDLDATGTSVMGNYGTHVAPGVLGAPEGVMLVSGAGVFRIPAGTYDLFTTHGPSWEADARRVTLTNKSNTLVTATLRHSVDTRGWMAADLHIHSGRSYDSQLPVEDRVVSEVAVGIELLVATDHNVLTNLQPDVELFGYGSFARAIVGDEFNFFEGHGGAYPMPYDPTDIFGGTVKLGLDWDRMRFLHSAEAFDFIHNFPTKPAVTVNHPRLPPDLGYFLNLKQYGPDGWAPPTTLDDAGSFDALEVLNGYAMQPPDIAALLRDWFFLLNNGHRVTALGSSDTHRLRGVKAGFPRTWLRMGSGDVTRIADADLAEAIRHGRAVASNGPFALLTVNGQPIGELARADTATLTAEITVDAPAWIDVDRVKLWVNGKVAWESPVAPGLRPIFHASVPIPTPATDSWVVLQASGTKPLPSALIGDPGSPPIQPIAITSPVFIDVDGDGQWRPNLPKDERDPGPIGPAREEVPRFAPSERDPAPLDCEPPLWVDPARWAIP